MILTLLPAAAGAVVVVPLHSDLPDTLKEPEISILGLFPDQKDLVSVWFERTAWGGVMAHLEIGHEPMVKNIERSIPGFRWLEMRQLASDLVAGRPINRKAHKSLVPNDSSGMIKAWPEVPARNREFPQEMASDLNQQLPGLAGRWLVSGALGYQHNITPYNKFFTDMVFFQLGIAHALTKNIIPYGTLTAGFGDLDSDYEKLVGDGFGSNYSALGGLILRAPVSRRTSLYVGAQTGFSQHSLQWGGVYEDPATGIQVQGHTRQYGDWGFGLQMGLMLQKNHKIKARFFDFNVGVVWGEVERWDDSATGVRFTAEGDSAWLMFMFRFWDQI